MPKKQTDGKKGYFIELDHAGGTEMIFQESYDAVFEYTPPEPAEQRSGSPKIANEKWVITLKEQDEQEGN